MLAASQEIRNRRLSALPKQTTDRIKRLNKNVLKGHGWALQKVDNSMPWSEYELISAKGSRTRAKSVINMLFSVLGDGSEARDAGTGSEIGGSENDEEDDPDATDEEVPKLDLKQRKPQEARVKGQTSSRPMSASQQPTQHLQRPRSQPQLQPLTRTANTSPTPILPAAPAPPAEAAAEPSPSTPTIATEQAVHVAVNGPLSSWVHHNMTNSTKTAFTAYKCTRIAKVVNNMRLEGSMEDGMLLLQSFNWNYEKTMLAWGKVEGVRLRVGAKGMGKGEDQSAAVAAGGGGVGWAASCGGS